ncbi:MAG TPA: hypothetical protein VER03_07735 [Bryobacteraceae bacterium]|nr:hypothetical protein [Bryobacteraceae bacterium]
MVGTRLAQVEAWWTSVETLLAALAGLAVAQIRKERELACTRLRTRSRHRFQWQRGRNWKAAFEKFLILH